IREGLEGGKGGQFRGSRIPKKTQRFIKEHSASLPFPRADGELFEHQHRTHDQERLFFQAEAGIRDLYVTGVQTCALPISRGRCVLRAPPRSIGSSPYGAG